jgi:hypothetical protein
MNQSTMFIYLLHSIQYLQSHNTHQDISIKSYFVWHSQTRWGPRVYDGQHASNLPCCHSYKKEVIFFIILSFYLEIYTNKS